MIGSSVASHRQVYEAFCDDEVIAGTDIEDVVRFKETMKKFMLQSGAILRRSSKSKISTSAAGQAV